MLKQILITALLISSINAFSQTRFSFFAGPQVTSANYTVRDIEQPTEYKQGIMAGIGLRFPFEGNLYFSPSLYYSQKGYDVTLNNPSFPPDPEAINNSTVLHTVEFSPMLHLAFSKKPTHIFLSFGPALDFNISGTEKFETKSGTTVERDMVFSFGDYGRITASGNVRLGLQTRAGFQIFGHYAHGLGSLNNADEGPKITHRVAGVSIGWMFGNNKPW